MSGWGFLKKIDLSTSNQGDNDVSNNDVKVIKDLKTYAFNQASECKAANVVLKYNIQKIYFNKIINDENFFNQEEERKTKLQNSLHDEEANLSKLINEIDNNEDKKKEINSEITVIRAKKEKIKGGDKTVLGEMQPPDKIGYYLSIFILFFLTAYLFLFYTSAIYNAFVYNVSAASKDSILHNKTIATTIFNPDAIKDSYQKNIVTFLFVVTSPIIFLGLGYLIHKFNESKKYIYTVLILLFTFLFDAILAYAIVSDIYEAKYITGLSGVNEPWKFNMIFSQVPFYIILGAGFVIYIVWGVVLNFVITGHNNLNPIRAALKNLDAEIKDLQKKLEECTAKLTDLNSKKTTTQGAINKIKTDLNHSRFNKENFELRVAEFMSGWHSWITQGLPYEKNVRQQEADKAKEEIISQLYNNNLITNEDVK